MTYARIDVKQAQELIANNALVVDIRDPNSYAAGAIAEAVHLSGENVDDFIRQSDLERPLIVCCYHGNASQGAAQFFLEKGFKQAYSLDGGYEAWAEFGQEF